MFRQEYEECLLRQLSIKEVRPFQAALPVTAGFSGSSSAVGPDMATPTKRSRIPLSSHSSRCLEDSDHFIPTPSGNNWQSEFSMMKENVTSGQPAEEAVRNDEIYFRGHILQNELLRGQSALAPMNGRKLFQIWKP
jgi:hypothetical protein